ncbi:hypothetical protein V8E55_003478 [Tylopilus felleus]
MCPGCREIFFRFEFTVAEEDTGNGRLTRVSKLPVVRWCGQVDQFPDETSGAGHLEDTWKHLSGVLMDAQWISTRKYDDKFTAAHRLQLLLGIANGLEYRMQSTYGYESPQNNVLLDDGCNARLTDFGYASLVGEIPDALGYSKHLLYALALFAEPHQGTFPIQKKCPIAQPRATSTLLEMWLSRCCRVNSHGQSFDATKSFYLSWPEVIDLTGHNPILSMTNTGHTLRLAVPDRQHDISPAVGALSPSRTIQYPHHLIPESSSSTVPPFRREPLTYNVPEGDNEAAEKPDYFRSIIKSVDQIPDQILIFPKQPPTCAQQVWCCVPPALESGPMGPDQLNLHRASGHLVQVIVAGSKMPTLCVLYQAVVLIRGPTTRNVRSIANGPAAARASLESMTALHLRRVQQDICRVDALNRHLRSEGGAECQRILDAARDAEVLLLWPGWSTPSSLERREQGNWTPNVEATLTMALMSKEIGFEVSRERNGITPNYRVSLP